ncbi:LacI family transcriptional regulator [Rhodoligotrophos appendicifer]
MMTVSNVVNRNYAAMRPETRDRVEKAIAQLGYRPRGTARSLRLDRNFAVGILIVDPLSSFLADPFISQVVAGLSNSLGERGYGCLVHGVRPEELERSIFLGDSRTDGICAFLSGDHAHRRDCLERLLKLHVPIIAIEDTNVGLHPDLAVVRQDDFGAAKAMTELFLAKGLRRFFVLAPQLPWPSVTQRLAGMNDAIKKGDSQAHLTIVPCGSGSIAEAERILPEFLHSSQEPAAIIGATDRLAVAVARFVTQREMPFPSSIGSFSASETSNDLAVFTIVAISEPYRIGREAGLLMVERIEKGAFRQQEVLIPIKLYQR